MAVHEWLQGLFRWIHVVAGILWIGLLYFLNFVNGPFTKTMDAETKKKVIPELMPRVLFFFRWGAMYTWVTGILLLAMVYYAYGMGLMATDEATRSTATIASILAFILAPIVYDRLWKSPLVKNEMVGVVVSFGLLVALMAGLSYGAHVGGRALFIHIGTVMGTIMAFNVWMRIWPTQKKIIGAIKAGTAVDPTWPTLAALRSKHNTYMSVPLVFTMVSNHFPMMFSFNDDLGWFILSIVVALSWIVTQRIYKIAGSASPASF